eukprot:5176880-Prymnesium_polylepis.1
MPSGRPGGGPPPRPRHPLIDARPAPVARPCAQPRRPRRSGRRWWAARREPRKRRSARRLRRSARLSGRRAMRS